MIIKNNVILKIGFVKEYINNNRYEPEYVIIF